ncbi:MAG: EamA family transporter [Actinobacteria bacterium]|nr:EamA family transporter [Actinomycetota bacterium]
MPTPTPWGVIMRTGLAPAIWGTTYAVTSELLPPGRPMFAGMLRALPAGLILLTLAPVKRPNLAWWKIGVLAALNIGVFFTLLFVGAYRLPGGVASTVTSFQPLYVAVLSSVVLRTAISRRTVLAGMAGIAGVALLVLRADAVLDPWGLAAAVGSSCCTGAGLVMAKRWAASVPPMTLAGWQLLLGGAMLVPATLMVEGLPTSIDAKGVGGLVYLATVGGALAYLLWFSGIQRLVPTQVSFLTLLTPVVATLLGWAALGQTLTPLQSVGAVLALAAAVFTQLPSGSVAERNAVERCAVECSAAERSALPTVPIAADAPAARAGDAPD